MSTERKFYIKLAEAEFVCQAENETEAIRKFWLHQAEKLFAIPTSSWLLLDVGSFDILFEYTIHEGDAQQAVQVDAGRAYATMDSNKWAILNYAFSWRYGYDQMDRWIDVSLERYYQELDAIYEATHA